ncbi:MAG: hypothetical protein M1461_00600 [Nitrospirae bacterium]|nr:hypothetical protein [Nitrospirota bacterium]
MIPRKLLAGIFLFSFSALSYEIALTRVFSISLWYHFAFMVISIAMLGIGASGTVLSLSPKLNAPSRHDLLPARIGIYGLFLGASITASYLLSNRLPFDPVRLSWDRVQLLYICLYYLLLSTPFFFFGLSVSTAFSSASERAGFLYGADLLGAGTGSISLLYFMSVTGPEVVILLVSSIALVGAFLMGGRKTKAGSCVLIACNIYLLLMPDLISPRMSPYKGLQLALRYPGAQHIKTYHSPFSQIDVFRSPAVRFAPGLSLKYLDPLPEQVGISIDGGEVNAVTGADNRESLGFLEFLPSALPYEIGKRESVLILEPRGGLEVVLAGYYDTENIFKVESNPLVIEVIRDDLGDLSHGVYDSNTWQGLGRSWLKARDRKFDLIDIPLTGTSPSGSFGIAEDYRFTVESFKEYLGHLTKSGMLSVHLYILPPPRIELRLLSTLITAMEEMGIKEVERKIVSIRSWGSVGIMAKVELFTREEIEGVRKFSREKRFDLILLPGIREEETNIYVKTPSNEYATAFMSILDPGRRASFQRDYLFDITPVRDEDPFFHYFLRLKNLRNIYEVMGGKWQYFIEEGYLLPAVFLQVLLLSIILILLPAMKKGKTTDKGNAGIKPLLYFAFLGIGFMFVEISLIQKMILPLENPSYAVTTVLTSLLIGSGIGSLLSSRFSLLSSPLTLLATTLLIAAYSLGISPFSDFVAPQPLLKKAALGFAFLIPLGLPMGIPFPLGMKNLGEKAPELIPWAWAVNGCASVLAPILTIMLAMAVGFQTVMWMGAAAYLLAFFTCPAPNLR